MQLFERRSFTRYLEQNLDHAVEDGCSGAFTSLVSVMGRA